MAARQIERWNDPMPVRIPAERRLAAATTDAELVEDELILAVPVVPVAPGTEAVERDWTASEEEVQRASPFSALSALKGKPES